MTSTLGGTVLTIALALSTTGCIKKMLLDGQIESTRKASTAVDTLHDYEVANKAAYAGLAQFEGMHYLAPDNEDALFLLTKGWAGATTAFTEDAMEQAEDSDEGTLGDAYKYHQARARAGYERALYFGLQLLEARNPGFEAAKRNDQTIKAWTRGFESPEDVPYLFWTGYAWLAKTNVAKEDPAVVAELFVGVAMIERAVALDENYLWGTGHVALGSYHARTPMAELEEAKKHFDRALQINGGKVLLAKFQLATKYYCGKQDKENYVRLLHEILAAGDVMPEQRLSNTVAKRKARRYLSEARMRNCGF